MIIINIISRLPPYHNPPTPRILTGATLQLSQGVSETSGEGDTSGGAGAVEEFVGGGAARDGADGEDGGGGADGEDFVEGGEVGEFDLVLNPREIWGVGLAAGP